MNNSWALGPLPWPIRFLKKHSSDGPFFVIGALISTKYRQPRHYAELQGQHEYGLFELDFSLMIWSVGSLLPRESAFYLSAKWRPFDS